MFGLGRPNLTITNNVLISEWAKTNKQLPYIVIIIIIIVIITIITKTTIIIIADNLY